jgi:hypothetical protein
MGVVMYCTAQLLSGEMSERALQEVNTFSAWSYEGASKSDGLSRCERSLTDVLCLGDEALIGDQRDEV